MFSIIQNFAQFLRVPLTFFPGSIQAFFHFVIVFFALFVSGKLWRWLLDLIPVA